MRRLVAAAFASLALAATPAEAGILVKPGLVAFDIRQNGLPVVQSDVEIAIRTRQEPLPRVVAEGRNQLRFELPEGDYDCIVIHHHIFTHPLKYHRFQVRAGATVPVVSEVKTRDVLVRPVAAGVPAADRVREVEIQNTNSGEVVRFALAGPVVLPEAQYRIRVRGIGTNGAPQVRERMITLACDEVLEIAF